MSNMGCDDGSCSSGSCSSGNCSSDKDRLPPGMLARYDLDKEIGLGTLVWIETEDGEVKDSVLEVLSAVKDAFDDRIFAMITGDVSIKPLYGVLFSYGVDSLYHIRSKEMEAYNAKWYAECFADLSVRLNPMLIVNSGTERGKELSALTAKILGTDYTPDCMDLRSAVSVIKHPRVVTVVPGTFKINEPEKGRRGTAIGRPYKLSLGQ